MNQKGFTLIEVVVAVTIFLIVSSGVYGGYNGLLSAINASRLKVIVASLINERFEIARNLPYTDVGTVGGIPSGKILSSQVLVRGGISWTVNTVIKNVDDPFDGLGGADPKPADYKLMEISVACATCKNFKTVSVTGTVAPRNLEP